MPPGLSNSDRSSALCSWAPVTGLLRPSSFSTPSGPRPHRLISVPPSASGALTPSARLRSGSRLPGCAVHPACAFRTLPYSNLGRFGFLDVPQSALLPVCGPVEALASRCLSPGIAFPFRVAPLVRPASTEPGPGDMLRTMGALGSVFLHPPLCLPAGRPSGRWVSSHGRIRLLPGFRSCQTYFCDGYVTQFNVRITSG